MTEALEKLQAMADKAAQAKSAQREALKAQYPDIHDFIVKLEETFGPVTGKVKRR
jgi:hypothetical protein